MTTRQIVKRIHLVATIWFIGCVGYLFVASLRQLGFHWWLASSLSEHFAFTILLVVGLCLFAFLQSIARTRHAQKEHPLTNSSYYLGFYVSAPLLGGLAAVLAASGVPERDKFLSCVALGTLGTTFLVWVVVDPLVGGTEMLVSTARRRRGAGRTGS
jgi:hypothetical protein